MFRNCVHISNTVFPLIEPHLPFEPHPIFQQISFSVFINARNVINEFTLIINFFTNFDLNSKSVLCNAKNIKIIE